MRLLHTADLHFSNKKEKLDEVVRTTDALLVEAAARRPDCAVLAGDTVDEHDGPIRLDSDAARAAISFVTRLAEICPVVIIRGTKSHDRESPYIFRQIRTRFPVHVASQIEHVALLSSPLRDPEFRSLVDVSPLERIDMVGVFSLVPSLSKEHFASQVSGVADGNARFRELVFDLFSGFGLVNETLPPDIPRVLVTHGMVAGSTLSSGETAVGEDLEFGTSDLRAARCDYVALGHVHKFQTFPGAICYSGSPGRLNFGEVEDKGFVMVDVDRNSPKLTFVPLPARKFALFSMEWSGDRAFILSEADRCEAMCSGHDVRFRYTIPEENRHEIDRAWLEQRFLAAGATRVKIEAITIPKQRTRAAGISRLVTLPQKVRRWGETVSLPIPARVFAIAERIEGLSRDDLVAESRARVSVPPTVVALDVPAEFNYAIDVCPEVGPFVLGAVA